MEEDLDLLLEKQQVYTVKQLSLIIKNEIEKLGYVYVRGEVSNAHLSHAGHFYFDLREENYTISVVLFKSRTRGLIRYPKDGEKIEVGGRLTTYEGKSQYQIIADVLVQRGIGELREAVEKLKKKLMAEGLFAEEHKKPLPLLPRRIGVVTSPHGAAIMDIIRTIRRRNSAVHIFLYPVRVQGEGAEDEIARGIEIFNRWGQVDVIIVGRGGGSFEDLMAFNTEKVARAIFASEIPVISAVGHEVDFTIADFVADLRAATPTAAAELVIKSRQELKEKLDAIEANLISMLKALINRRRREFLEAERGLRAIETRFFNILRDYDRIYERLIHSLPRSLETKRRRLSSLTLSLLRISPTSQATRKIMQLRERLTAASPSSRVAFYREKLRGFENQLSRTITISLEKREKELEKFVSQLRMLSPYSVLERGYSIVLKDKKVIKDSAQVKKGDRIEIKLHKGKLDAQVKGTWTLPIE
ncbi:MAG: exodeoxyribonuclease VII large subunit [Candidatus Aminicenantes bacterium]|nr:exodeoxyribonuclease VII large subunit [Candidatus Aminicenantes bacterium]